MNKRENAPNVFCLRRQRRNHLPYGLRVSVVNVLKHSMVVH